MLKTNIPESVEDLLKCDECYYLLSCGPVYVLPETAQTICGRCSQLPESKNLTENRDIFRIRNKKFEAAAKLLRFPCYYADHGCPEFIDFCEDEPNLHERNCEFRWFVCPMAPRNMCDVINSWEELETHCRDKHTSQILENPCQLLKLDLSKPNLKTYLISAFDFLFLLHVKVTADKLFHSVLMIGDTKFLTSFSFHLILEGSNMNLSKFGSVFSVGDTSFQEITSLCTNINELNRFDEKFKTVITIERKK